MGAHRPRDGQPSAEPQGPTGQLCPVLIGRGELLALAGRRLASAAAGTGQMLLMSGEAGIGKTRLLTEIIGQAGTLGFQVVGAGAFPRDAEVAGSLLADLAADMQRTPLCSAVGLRITRRLADMVNDQGRTGDAHRHRRMLVSDLAEAITSLGPEPVLIALEDLHWADDSTLEVLDRIAGRLSELPILLVGTYRSDELYPRLPLRSWRSRLLTQRLAEEVRLNRLGRADTAAMTAAISRSVLSSEVTGAVFARSDGIPLHVEEFLASLQITGGAAESVIGVPDTLADAVLARADLLTASARELAAAASVIGRSFDIDLLAAITDESPAAIDSGVRELTDRFFIAPHAPQSTVVHVAGRPTAPVPIAHDSPSFDFRHALIRDALYSDLTPHRRRDLHARTADAAAAAGFSDAFVSDQFERANRPAAAYQRALTGALDAVAISAHREAVQLYRRAQRTAPLEIPAAERADLLTALGVELAAIDDNVEAAEAYEQAFALRRGLGDDLAAAALVPALVAVQHLLGVGLPDRATRLRAALSLISSLDGVAVPQTRRRLYAALSAAYMLDRRLDEAIEVGERAIAATNYGNISSATTLDDQATGCNLAATLGSVLVFAGRMDEGWLLLADSITRATAARLEAEAARGYRMLATSASVLVEYDRALTWLRAGVEYTDRTERFNDRHYMAAHLAHVYWAVGDWPTAEPLAQQALADCGDGVTTRITALHVLGFLALGRGETVDAHSFLTEAAALGTKMNELQRMSPAWWGLAENASLAGRPEQSIEWCERGYQASVAVQDAAYLFPFLLTGVRARLTAGDATGARDWVDRCRQLLLRRNIPGTLGAIEHAEGLLHLHDGQTGKARESLAGASAFWDERRRFWEGTQALIDRARCAARSRRPAAATELAGQAIQRAATIGAHPLVAAAEQQLTGTAAAVPAPLLTAREVEIAGLVATGATNREIATTLFISPKTVAAHIEHILGKLGAARRAQIASWVASQPAARRPSGDRHVR